MKKYTLTGKSRDIMGRKVKSLRSDGFLPATVYGKKVSSDNLTVNTADFLAVYNAAGETGLVELTIDGVVKPVLIHSVQKHPVRGDLIHVEFHQVDLKEKVKAQVPLVIIGESPAVAQKAGVLLTLIPEVEVEALPTDLPEKIEVNVTSLAEVDQEIKVSDLQVPSGVTMLSDASVSVVKVGSLVSKEAEAQAAAEAAPTAEGETPAVSTTEAVNDAQPADKPKPEEKKE